MKKSGVSKNLAREKTKAEVMMQVATSPEEASYWRGYRTGLTCQSEAHNLILQAMNSEDPIRREFARGYADGRKFVMQEEEI